MTQETQNNTSMTKEDFLKILDKHDWHYEYSDDHSVWKRGYAAESAIKAMIACNPELFLTFQVEAMKNGRRI